MERVTHLLKKMTRLKTITDSFHHTELRRCLTTFDLTLLGIGHMVGSGIYVLSGTIVNTKAGPSAILSYLFAGVAALLSALCYAEFGARIPKAGSAYSYTYVTIGEIWGFLVGWNLLLEYVLGTAAVGRSWSGTVDSLFDGAIRNGTLKYVGYLSHDSEWVSEYPDFLAAGIIMVMFLVVSAGAKQSLILNSLFTILNMFVILFILCFGFSHADVAYWTDSQFGGFFPFGVSGTLSAAASCFFAYIGFEGIGVAGEEAHNPAKSIPLATLVAILVVTVTYMSATSALTLMVPYYDVSLTAAFPAALERVGATWERYLVTVGTLIGISCSMLGGAFGMPRTVYAMANDGLLLRCLGNVNPFTHTPILSTLLFGTLTAILALFISMETLVEFLSVGTLFVYSVVAANLIILRYSPDERFKVKSPIINTQSSEIEKLSIQKGFQYSSVDPVEMVLHVEKQSKTTGKDEVSFYENGYDQRSENFPCRKVCEDVSEKLHHERDFDQTDTGIYSNKKDVSDKLTCEYNFEEKDEEKRSRNGRSHEAEDEVCRKRDIGETGKEITSPEKSVKNSMYRCRETPNCSHSLSQDTGRTPIISKTDGFRSIGGLKPSFQRVPLLKDLSPGRGVAISVGCLIPLMLGLALALIVGADLVGEGVWWMVIVIVLLVVFVVFFVLVIVAHEQNVTFSTFQMPLVPYLPLLSILINLMLMMSLSAITWLRLLVWVALGFVVYFSYGLHHSLENENSCHGPTPPLQMQHNSDNQETTTAISAPKTKDCND